jgi:DNA polymerase II large subunit
MPTPETPDPEAVRQLDEAGASGGAPAEANPPQTLEELDVWLAKRMAEEIGEEYEFTLITVEQDGNVEVNFYNNLKDVADKILEQIEETVAADLKLDLPNYEAMFEARLITTDDTGLYYIVEEEYNRWLVRHVIPASKSEFYIANEEVLSSISNSKLYVIGKAVKVRGSIFYQIFISRTQIRDVEAELKFIMLGESP